MTQDTDVKFPDMLMNSAQEIPSPERAQEMLDVNIEYAKCFMNKDFDGMQKYLIDSPEFEMQPLGIKISGRPAVRKRSERLQSRVIAQVDPREGKASEIRSVAYGKDTFVLEWSNDFILPDGSTKRCYSIAVIPYDGNKMGGERVYTCQNLAELRSDALGDDFLDHEGVTKL